MTGSERRGMLIDLDSRARRELMAAFALPLLLRLVLSGLVDFCLDDAYITFRVARNIARGLGMVYNPGEQVLAITTPLYALLMVPGELLGIGGPLFSRILNSFCAAGSCALVYLLLRGRVSRTVLWAAVAWLAVNPMSIFITLTGMETAVLSFLLLLSAWLLQKRLFTALGAALGLCCLTRPEGCIAAGLFWAYLLAFRREGLLRTTIPILVLAGGWAVYSTVVFGSPVPNSYTAKKAFFTVHHFTRMKHLHNYRLFFMPALPLAFAAPLLLVLGGWRQLRRRTAMLPLAVWLAAIVILQLLSRFPITLWYMHMLVPPALLLMAEGAEGARLMLGGRPAEDSKPRRSAAAITAAVLAAYLAVFTPRAAYVCEDLRSLDMHMGSIGRWFVENDIPRDRTVGLEAIGRVGYESDLHILDRMGLASPQVIPCIRARRDSDPSIMNTFRPDYFVCGSVLSGEEVPGYRPVAEFGFPELERARRTGAETAPRTYIYSRVEQPRAD